jgi:hypothetical protein
MALTANLDQREIRNYTCDCCRAPVERVWNYVYRDDVPHAVYFANSYHHRDQPHETWIDVILGTWGEGAVDDHVTFGCRVGPVVDSPAPAATLVQACLDGSSGRLHGAVLSREEGLAHPRLPEFWEVVDFVLANDPTVHQHVYAS